MLKRIAVLSGAGMSADSGIQTFRGADGLWCGHRVEDVATPEAFQRDPELVLEFYNQRRKNVIEANPNAGHLALVDLESDFQVDIITQNVDDLHERSGSSNVCHLHGEIRKARSTKNARLVYDIDGPSLVMGDLAKDGSQLRPHIVWFGEAVPEMERAIPLVERADLVLVIGTSLLVYPAAGLVSAAEENVPCILVDPFPPRIHRKHTFVIEDTAASGVPRIVQHLLGIQKDSELSAFFKEVQP